MRPPANVEFRLDDVIDLERSSLSSCVRLGAWDVPRWWPCRTGYPRGVGHASEARVSVSAWIRSASLRLWARWVSGPPPVPCRGGWSASASRRPELLSGGRQSLPTPRTGGSRTEHGGRIPSFIACASRILRGPEPPWTWWMTLTLTGGPRNGPSSPRQSSLRPWRQPT